MSTKYMTHEELQHIEHCNKILKDHLECIKVVVEQSELALNNYIPVLRTYVNAITEIRTAFGNEVTHIFQSTRQLGLVTKNSQDIHNFVQAVMQLDKILTPSLVEKLNAITRSNNEGQGIS
jgi:hypothetical protein